MSTDSEAMPHTEADETFYDPGSPEVRNEKANNEKPHSEWHEGGMRLLDHTDLDDLKFTTTNLLSLVDEAILIFGGPAAILLQVAHPGVGAGVNQHSNFAYRVMDRLRTTLTFVYCIAYGTPEERMQVVNSVTRIHSKVNGQIKDGKDQGKKYAALDPELQKWVAATLYATGVIVYESVLGPFDEKKSDLIYEEFSKVALVLQVPTSSWPATRKDFWEYWDYTVDNVLEITQDAREICEDMFYKARIPFYFKPGMPTLRVLTAEYLPERLRIGFGLKRHRRTYKIHEFLAKATYPMMPMFIRRSLVTYYMKDMRKRLKEQRQIFGKDEAV